jgi:outer membrane protein insertion porin family
MFIKNKYVLQALIGRTLRIMALSVLVAVGLNGQVDLPVHDYSEERTFEIGGVEVEGNQYSDANAIRTIAGLQTGNRIVLPGPDIPKAMKALWRLRLFTDVQIVQTKAVGDVVFLLITVVERPRLSGHAFTGVKKGQHDDLNAEINRFLNKGGIVTNDIKANAVSALKWFYRDKGYHDVEVEVEEVIDTGRVNAVRLVFDIDKKERVKVSSIEFEGNLAVKDRKLRKVMKNTKKRWTIFKKSKLVRADYKEDKKSIVSYYNTVGYRDARIAGDSMWRDDKGHINLLIDIDEGNQYYFRDISWKGNSLYTNERLSEVLGITKGDVYNKELLDARLSFSLDGRDVTSLYMDDGYLFFTVDPIEIAVENDSIDLEMRIFEGPQATIDRVTVAGNDRTHEHVIRRELYTRPGEKFSRSAIIRSQRQITNLGYFNPENLNINTPVNPSRYTVDIEYSVEERPSDQLELSAGYGGFTGLLGTLGVTFNNFSIRNLFNRSAWHPLPMGDGQKLSLRAQSNGRFLQTYNFSFTEPWLGGKKPNSFSVGSVFTNIDRTAVGQLGRLQIIRGFTGLGTRLRFPDDNFISNTTINLENIYLDEYPGFVGEGRTIRTGRFNNFNIRQTIARNSISDPLFPRSGSRISLTMQFTPPYSLFRKDNNFDEVRFEEKFKWLEYHKWRLDAEWYFTLIGKLVLKSSIKLGILGFYDENIGIPPFERFELGGDGLTNQQQAIIGRDIFALRGYEVTDLPANDPSVGGASVFQKISFELRYPISTNPNSTIWIHSFLDGGNSWVGTRNYQPFNMMRSTGIGLRVFLPMFGLLGFDYGFGIDKFDDYNPNRGLSDFGRFNFIIGFEPD